MTMHLLPPMYSTTGKKKGKQKHRTSDHAAKARKNAESWQQLMEKWNVDPNKKVVSKSRSSRQVNTASLDSNPRSWRDRIDPRRLTDHIPSVDNGVGVAVKRESPQYTGENMLGIGQLHKSNAVPVFKQSDAEDIAKMRR